MQDMWVPSLGQEDPLEEEMATRYNIPAWRIPGMEEPGGLQSMGSQKSQTRLSTHAVIDKTCVLINMVDYTDWFSNVKLVLHSWDKPYLDMMDYNLHT